MAPSCLTHPIRCLQALGMSSEASAPRKKLPVAALAGACLVVAAVALIALRGTDLHLLSTRVQAGVAQGVQTIRGLGPWVFFAAVAFLPAFGAPLLAFTIPAGELFGPQLTIPGVIAATLAAIAVNLAFTYGLARYALRPLLSKLVTRYGYSVPRVTPANALTIVLVLRLTPGPPFFLQSYILGLAEVPFRLYMVASWLSLIPMTVGAVILGHGLLNGNFRLALSGLGVLVVFVAVVHWLRNRYAARSK